MKTRKPNNLGKNLQHGLLGLAIISLGLGSMFWITLVKYSLFIFLAGTLGTVIYLMEGLTSHHENKKPKKSTFIIGITSLTLLMLSLGIQSPQLPFKIYIILIGLAFILFASIKFLRKKTNEPSTKAIWKLTI